MSDERDRTAELIERLLGDPELRRRFRSDPASVLTAAGLPELAVGLGTGPRAMMTLELRESRSSLAGVLVAAAAEAVDFAKLVEHAAPALAREVDHLVSPPAHHPALHPSPRPSPIARSAPAAPPAPASAPSAPGAGTAVPSSHPGPPLPPAPTARAAAAASRVPAPVSAAASPANPQPAAPAEGAQLVIDSAAGAGAHPGAAVHHPGAAAPGHQPHARHHDAAGPGPIAPEPADPLLTYPGDAASPEAIAGWMAAHAQRAGLPPELPLMAALTESGLRNLNYGDRDSVGFFQMRLGIWNEGPYAGYPDHPDLQIQWFIDHALAVKAENPGLAASPSSWGEWVAGVEQPAAEYRYRYQLQLEAAQALLHGAALAPGSGAVAPIPVGEAAVHAALRLVSHGAGAAGAGEAAGGSIGGSLQTGPSPAGLVQYAYARQDIQLPSVAAQQFDLGVGVARHALKPGDAVFFSDPDGVIRRVGLYVGDGKFVAALPSGGIRVEHLDDPAFSSAFAGARRFTAQSINGPASYARPLPTITR